MVGSGVKADPPEVVEILRHVTPSRLKMMDIVLESLQRLNCMGYRVVIATSRPDDKEEKAFVWMQNWLGDRHVRIGNRGLVLKLAFPVDNQSTRVRDEVMSIGVDMTLPGGVAIDQEDERIICEMRHREPEREVYCREFEVSKGRQVSLTIVHVGEDEAVSIHLGISTGRQAPARAVSGYKPSAKDVALWRLRLEWATGRLDESQCMVEPSGEN